MAGRTQKKHARLGGWGYGSAFQTLLSFGRPVLKLALAAGILAQTSGCTRYFFRKRADKEVAEVLAQKDKYPAWQIENWHVYADPKARFADPCDPDHPPKPPDDPAAYDLSPNPQKPGKAGIARTEGTGYLELIARWDRENRERRTQAEEAERLKNAEPPASEEQEVRPPSLAGLDGLPAGQEAQPVIKAFYKQGPSAGETPAIQKVWASVQMPDQSLAKSAPVHADAIVEAKGRSLLDISDRPAYLLTLDQAAELATFNSREFQDQRENLYLAALPVTVERFAFMAQFFAAEEAVRGASGSKIAGGPTNSWTLNSGTGFSKILPTGALLLFNFANQTVFDFVNPKKTLSATTLNFNAIQPLLRGGGRAVALEPLTQSERNLLYAIRSFARFRKELYVAIASSSGGSISGGSFQPSGVLSGNGINNAGGVGGSGLTPGIVPPVTTNLNGPILPPFSPGALALAGAITPPPSGYLNTMLRKIQVYIDQEDIDVLSDILLRFRGLLEGDVVGPLQIQSVEQQLLAGRTTLLLDQQQYLVALNAFKLEIGVPMKLNIETDDAPLRPLTNQFRRSRAIIENEQAALGEASDMLAIEKAPRLRPELLRLFEKSAIVRGTPFAGSIRGRWGEWSRLSNQDLTARLEEYRKELTTLLDQQADLQRKGQLPTPADQARLKAVSGLRDLGNFERVLRLYEANYVEMGKPKKPDAVGERQRIRQFQSVVSSWQKVLVEARDQQWLVVSASWPELPRCCVDGVDLVNDDLAHAQAAGAQHALTNRLDLMNVRAQSVDAWRQLAVFANALQGTFNVGYQLNASTPMGLAQPLNIGGSATSHQLVLNTELPLTRIRERNNYRASLIAFQRQRRTLQEAEDLAVQAVDGELFVLRQFAEAYKIQQRQLELAYLTIDSSLESLEAPTPPPAIPGLPGSRGGGDGPAALTQQLLSAQRSLPAAQTGLLNLWIQYLNARMQLFRDLELLPLDQRGVWIDEIKDCDCSLNAPQPAAVELLPPAKGQPSATPQTLPPLNGPAMK